jgi:hypothetical protein
MEANPTRFALKFAAVGTLCVLVAAILITAVISWRAHEAVRDTEQVGPPHQHRLNDATDLVRDLRRHLTER